MRDVAAVENDTVFQCQWPLTETAMLVVAMHCLDSTSIIVVSDDNQVINQNVHDLLLHPLVKSIQTVECLPGLHSHLSREILAFRAHEVLIEVGEWDIAEQQSEYFQKVFLQLDHE